MFGKTKGLVQATYRELSMLHSKWLIPTPESSLSPVSSPENSNDIESESVMVPLSKMVLFPSIALLIVVLGATVSTVQVNEAGEKLIFPTWSTALTLNLWVPSPTKFRNSNGLVQATYLELSMLHSRWPTPTPLSVPEKANLIEVDSLLPLFETVLLLPSTAETIEVVGAVVSTVHVK